jgi:hypothetical protein
MTSFEQGYYAFMKLAAGDERMLDEESVEYQPSSPHPNQSCGRCSHFQKNGTCDIVLGRISEYGWCNRFSPAGDPVPG